MNLLVALSVLLSTMAVNDSPALKCPVKIKQGAVAVIEVLDPAVVSAEGLWQERTFLFSRTPSNRLISLVAIDMLEEATELEIAVSMKTGDGDSYVRKCNVVVEAVAWPTQYIELKDNSKVDLNQADLDRVVAENERIGKLWPIENPVVWRGNFNPPYADFRADGDGRFGHRRFINGEPRNPHSGADYSGERGRPVLAVNSGKVVLVMDHFFSGNSVFIDHGLGIYSMYFHLAKVDVAEGQTVKKGERIGEVGSTGRATGPHLHLGYRINGARVDPRSVLKLELE